LPRSGSGSSSACSSLKIVLLCWFAAYFFAVTTSSCCSVTSSRGVARVSFMRQQPIVGSQMAMVNLPLCCLRRTCLASFPSLLFFFCFFPFLESALAMLAAAASSHLHAFETFDSNYKIKFKRGPTCCTSVVVKIKVLGISCDPRSAGLDATFKRDD